MEALKFSIWRLLVEAMALTSVAALIPFVGSILLAPSIARLTSTYSNAQTRRKVLTKLYPVLTNSLRPVCRAARIRLRTQSADDRTMALVTEQGVNR